MQSENKTVNYLTGRLLLEESRLLQQDNTFNIVVEKSSPFSAKSQSKFGWKTISHKKDKYNFVNSKKVGPCFYCENVDQERMPELSQKARGYEYEIVGQR